MKKTCETCQHRRDFKVIGLEVFPSICNAPTAKKHEFGLRFTEVMRKDGWLKAWLFNTCGKRGRWYQPMFVDELLTEVWNRFSIKGYQSIRPSKSHVPPHPAPRPPNRPNQESVWFEESAPITKIQWEELSKSINDFKHHGLPKPVRPAPPMPKIKPPKEPL